jgi:putative Mn2+ efflux pump MntP
MLGPLLLIVIGVLFLLNNMYPGVFRFGKMWPVILIVIGLAKVFEYFQGHPEKTNDNPERPEDKKEGQ